MVRPIKLKKSPLIEAILDIRTITDPNLPQEIFEKYYLEIGKEFTVKNVNTLMHASFEMKPGEPTKFDSDSKPNGFVFKTPDNTKLVQFRRDGFTFHLVNSYKDWEPFSDEAKKHFQKYLELIQPKLISRVALRYINLIQIPLPFKNFNEYLLTIPVIASNLPQQLTEFQMRVVVPDEKKENIAIITEGIDLNRLKANNAFLPFIFDIDVFRLINFEPNIDIVWEKFDGIRKYRSKIFFNSITGKTVRLFI